MTSSIKTFPIPTFFDPKNAADWNYGPDAGALLVAAQAYRQKHSIPTLAGSIKAKAPRVHVLGIDLQKDFCFPQGSLFVGGRSGRGAIDDNVRFAQFVYQNVGTITDITTTFDTHFAYQIFFSSFWHDGTGNFVAPFTMITTAEVRKGTYVPNPAMCAVLGCTYTWLRKQVEFYCSELERQGKYTLFIWPFHCLLGSAGHTLAGVIHEARLFFSFVRGAQSWAEVKGGHPLTENYSVFKPEVTTSFDGTHTFGQRNTNLISTLSRSDVVVVGGQAASHCVASSIDDFLVEIKAQDPALLAKVYILRDCMSPVVSPAMDFSPMAESALKKFAAEGMHVVDSTTPMADWPDIDSRIAA
jgi:nicotinamidase-related amidase